MTPKIFATIYVTAQKLREDSYVAARRLNNNFMGGHYGKSYGEAALEAIRIHRQPEVWAQPIEFLMIGAWNDAADWAKEQI